MKFIRLNKGTVRCILTAEDMEEYGIGIDDFIEQNDQVSDFIQELLEKAGAEVGNVSQSGNVTKIKNMMQHFYEFVKSASFEEYIPNSTYSPDQWCKISREKRVFFLEFFYGCLLGRLFVFQIFYFL